MASQFTFIAAGSFFIEMMRNREPAQNNYKSVKAANEVFKGVSGWWANQSGNGRGINKQRPMRGPNCHQREVRRRPVT
jgi:hypothetical protein